MFQSNLNAVNRRAKRKCANSSIPIPLFCFALVGNDEFVRYRQVSQTDYAFFFPTIEPAVNSHPRHIKNLRQMLDFIALTAQNQTMAAFAKQMSRPVFDSFLQGNGFFTSQLNKSLLHNKSIQESKAFIK